MNIEEMKLSTCDTPLYCEDFDESDLNDDYTGAKGWDMYEEMYEREQKIREETGRCLIY